MVLMISEFPSLPIIIRLKSKVELNDNNKLETFTEVKMNAINRKIM